MAGTVYPSCRQPVLYVSHDETLLERTANVILHLEQLRKKSQRLAELTKLLKLDEKDRELLDSAPDEGEEAPTRKVVGRER